MASYLGTFQTSYPAFGGAGNVTPDPPTVSFNTSTRVLSAAHALGTSELEYRHGTGGAVTAYAALLIDGSAHAAGEWQFRVKAAAGRNVSAWADSPEITAASTSPTTYSLTAADMWYNAYSSVGTGVRSSFAEIKFSGVPGGSLVTVGWLAALFNQNPECCHITVWDENAAGAQRICLQDLPSSSTGANTATFTLPGTSATSYTLAFADGGQQRNDDNGTPLDCRLTSVTLIGTKMAPQYQATGLYFLGDSISNGVGATSSQYAWPLVSRRLKRTNDVVIDAWGSRSWYRSQGSSGLRTATANQIATVGTHYTSVLLRSLLGTNDPGLFGSSTTPEGTAEIARQLFELVSVPNKAFIQPLLRANDDQIGVPAYRTAFAAALSTVIPSSDWTISYADGLHPNDAGNVALEAYIHDSLSYTAAPVTVTGQDAKWATTAGVWEDTTTPAGRKFSGSAVAGRNIQHTGSGNITLIFATAPSGGMIDILVAGTLVTSINQSTTGTVTIPISAAGSRIIEIRKSATGAGQYIFIDQLSTTSGSFQTPPPPATTARVFETPELTEVGTWSGETLQGNDTTDGVVRYSNTSGATATSPSYAAAGWEYWANTSPSGGDGLFEVVRASDNVVLWSQAISVSTSPAQYPHLIAAKTGLNPAVPSYARLTQTANYVSIDAFVARY